MQKSLNNNLNAKNLGNIDHAVSSASLVQSAGDFVEVLDAHPAGGLIFCIIVAVLGIRWKNRDTK